MYDLDRYWILIFTCDSHERWSDYLGTCEKVREPLRSSSILAQLIDIRSTYDRIDVGGKLMTNHLKHLISFRQWNMLDQTCVVNSVREACGYVTLDWKGDIELCK